MDLDCGFRDQIEEFVEYITCQDWSILFNTQFGVQLGIRNIGYVINEGCLFELFSSPFMTKEQLFDINESTDAFESAGDDELIAMISRDDAYEIKLKNRMQLNIHCAKKFCRYGLSHID